MNVEDIARVCHNANKAYCECLGDNSQKPWEECPEWQKNSAVNGVKFIVENPGASPAASHESWLEEKRKEGWKYGKVKDETKKEHPCFLPYERLPVEQRAKDYIFGAIARSLIPFIGQEIKADESVTTIKDTGKIEANNIAVDNRSFDQKIQDATSYSDDGRRTVDLSTLTK